MIKNQPTSILGRMGATGETSGPDVDQFDPEEPYRAVGYCRKAWGGEPMLDFIFKDGNSEAIAYSDIRRISFNPSFGITILTSDSQIEIHGHGLRECHRKLLQFRVAFIVEADDVALRLHEGLTPMVERIDFLSQMSG